MRRRLAAVTIKAAQVTLLMTSVRVVDWGMVAKTARVSGEFFLYWMAGDREPRTSAFQTHKTPA